MKSNAMVLLWMSVFLGALIRENISSNITQISFKSTSINYTLSSGNETASMNMSQTHEIVIKSGDEMVNAGRFQGNVQRIKCNISTDCENPRTQCLNRTCVSYCNNTADCGDDPRVTCKNLLCQCSRFHYRDQNSGECIPNTTRILLWSRNSAKTESGAESQPSAFIIKQTEPYTVLEPIWTEYRGNKTIGLGFVPTPVWAVVVSIGILFLVYSLIIFDQL